MVILIRRKAKRVNLAGGADDARPDGAAEQAGLLLRGRAAQLGGRGEDVGPVQDQGTKSQKIL